MSIIKQIFRKRHTSDKQSETPTAKVEQRKQTNKSKVIVRSQTMNKDVKCPYCSVVLEKRPTRKKKCPSCSEPIYVRKGRLLTKQQTDTLDAVKRLEMFDVAESDFENTRNSLRDEFGSEPSINDVVWRILNHLISKTNSRSNLQSIYYEMAGIAIAEGKDPKPYQKQAIRQNLLDYKNMNLKKVEILGIEDNFTCEYCKSLKNKVIIIDHALKEMPIPGECSSPEGCRCIYTPADDDL